jgi:phosphopantetheinyl transferase (holo-ACP synthase)
MEKISTYSKFIDTIKKNDFLTFYSTNKPETLFSERELQKFKFPVNAGSLAGRYLIKKTICDFIKDNERMNDIEILNDDFGKPEVFLGTNIRREIENAGIKNIYCSISHSKNFISGMTIFCF